MTSITCQSCLDLLFFFQLFEEELFFFLVFFNWSLMIDASQLSYLSSVQNPWDIPSYYLRVLGLG